MKGIIGLIVCLCIGTLIMSMLLTGEVVKDLGKRLPIAFGAALGDSIQIHLGVSPLVIKADPPLSGRKKALSWPEWIEGHYQIHDASGNPIQLERMGTSGLLLGQKVAGAPEFVVWAELTKGASYTFDHVPIMAKTNRYRYSFSAPNEDTEGRTANFQTRSGRGLLIVAAGGCDVIARLPVRRILADGRARRGWRTRTIPSTL